MKTIRNCDHVFSYDCPKDWEKLQPTDAASIRSCSFCRKNVHLTTTVEEAIALARKGTFVARETPTRPEVPAPEGGVGDCRSVEPPEELREELSREERISIVLADARKPHRDCPGCKAPVGYLRKTCPLCRYAIGRAMPPDA
ncbi:MAG TPA: hypothetical protein VNM14_13000 [Planctomycetota bacterium]|nr:hypothetical protein [Planctomycetota bacterium]